MAWSATPYESSLPPRAFVSELSELPEDAIPRRHRYHLGRMKLPSAMLAVTLAAVGCGSSDDASVSDRSLDGDQTDGSGVTAVPPRIISVTTDQSRLVAGQLFSAQVTVENTTEIGLRSLSLSLLFDVAGSDVSGSFVVTSDQAVTLPAPNSVAAVDFAVRINERFAGGTVRVDALAVGLDGSGASFATNGAETVAVITVVPITTLTVNTSADENTLGSETTLESAGETLSLREAILIANASEPPVLIDYAANLPERSITLGEPLPTLTANQVIVDGTELELIPSGSGVADYSWMVAGEDVIIRGLSMRSFQRQGLGCLGTTEESERLLLDTVTFDDCAGSKAAVSLNQGTGHSVLDSTFVGERAIRATGSVSLTVQASSFAGAEALHITEGEEIILSDNSLSGGAAGAIAIRLSAEQFTVRRNFIENTDIGSGPAISIASSAFGTVSDNTFSGSRRADVQFGEDVDTVDVRDNIHSTTAYPLRYGSVNPTLPAPTISRFDGESVTGSTDQSGRLDILVARSGQSVWELASRIAHPGGEFSAAIPSPRGAAVTALLTPLNQSTSPAAVPISFPATLAISTAEDELDGDPQTLNTVTDAGGLDDLSLREALVIATNLPGSQRITLADELDGDVVITPNSGLPAINGDIEFDGLGRLTINGSAIAGPQSPLIRANDADEVAVRGLRVIDYAGLVFDLSARDSIAFEGNIVVSSVAGVRTSTESLTTIEANTLTDISAIAIHAWRSTALTITGNRVNSAESAVVLGDRIDRAEVFANRVFNVGFGVVVEGLVDDALIAFNTLDTVDTTAILLDPADSQTYRVSSNIIVRAALGLSGAGASFDFNALFNNTQNYESAAEVGMNDLTVEPGIDLSVDDATPTMALVDTGDTNTLLDRNGALPGSWNGHGPDIGAVETGP